MTEGCPVCSWSGEIARSHDGTHRYYTHVATIEGELLTGRTCSERTEPRKKGLLRRLLP